MRGTRCRSCFSKERLAAGLSKVVRVMENTLDVTYVFPSNANFNR